MPDPTIFIDHTGEARKLGLLAPPRRLVGSNPPYDNEPVDPADYIEFDEWPDEVKVKNQGQRSACNIHGLAVGTELARHGQGQPHVPLDAWILYAILCQGNDQGSSILEGLEKGKTFGFAPEGTVPWGTIDPRLIPADAAARAARNRIAYGQDLTSRDEIMSAVQRKQMLNLSICVGPGFDQLDQEGVPRLGTGMDNHAVAVGYGCKWSSRLQDFLLKSPNSWGTAWGLDGFMWLPLKRLGLTPWFSAIRIKAVAEDPEDPDALPNFGG